MDIGSQGNENLSRKISAFLSLIAFGFATEITHKSLLFLGLNFYNIAID
jgi:hypothetical protein